MIGVLDRRTINPADQGCGMKRLAFVAIILVVIVAFFFVPFLPESSITPAGPRSALISPSFGLFQCGAFVGSVVIEVPNGAIVNGEAPFWAASSNWNCQFPRLVR